jgi:AAA domain
MTAFAKDNRIDVLMVDPLVSFHSVPENDNGAMDLVIKGGFGAIANQANAAVELFHHPGKPKPGQVETVVEDGRGASSVLWAVRSARVLNFMTPDEAAKLGIAEDERRMHVRIANGKANMGPLGKAEWMRLKVEKLINGDMVVVASHWTPPNPFENVTSAHMELARRLAATGDYRADSRSPKWLGYAIAESLSVPVSFRADNEPKDLARLHAIIKIWLKNKALDVETRKDGDGKDRQFIISGPFRPEPQAASHSTVYADDEFSIQ